DILKEYAARGTYIFPPEPSVRLAADTIRYCADRLPLWNSISVTGYHVREAGATAVQEVAFSFANAIAYVEELIEKGMEVDSFAPRISFFFGAHNDFFEEVAKFRAARRLWAKIMKERFKASNPRSLMLRFANQTSGSTLTAQQPENNIVRTTLQCLASVLGGTQSLACACMDEALALPTEKAARIALRTQQIIAHESGAADTIDPLAGSYVVESLTNQIEEEAAKYIEKIDAMGGAVRAIEKGFLQKEIADAAYKYQKDVENCDKIVVGVNKFTEEEKHAVELHKVDPEAEKKQTEKLKKLREERNNRLVKKSLENLERAAAGDGNMLPPILEAVKVYATLGEICDVMRKVWGVYRPQVVY
ncbi:MAG: methylmalonyl-CoA mutase family protein, partial [bacterium]